MNWKATSPTIGRSGIGEQRLYVYGGDKPYVPSPSEQQRRNPGAASTRVADKAERLRRFAEHRANGVGVFESGALVGIKQRAARRYEQQRLAALAQQQERERQCEGCPP